MVCLILKMQHKITALTIQKKNRNRVSVYLDGDYAFGLARIVAAWLSVGQEISDEKIEQLQAEDEFEVAYQKGLHYLSYRPRSEYELRQYLIRNKIQPEIQQRILERLKQSKLINDRQFASTWVENRSQHRPRSSRMLAVELKQFGIDPMIIQDSIYGIDEGNLAYQAAIKQSRKYERLEWEDFRRKMFGYLSRRGFNYETSKETIQQVWNEIHHSHEE